MMSASTTAIEATPAALSPSRTNINFSIRIRRRRSCSILPPNLFLLLLPLLLSSSFFFFSSFVSATIECTHNHLQFGDTFCEEKYRIGSYCTSKGFCSNPFQKGCLRQVLPKYFHNSTNHDHNKGNHHRTLRTTSSSTPRRKLTTTWHQKLRRSLLSLHNYVPPQQQYKFINNDRLRTCNSEDDLTLPTDEDDDDDPVCIPSQFHYDEVRILSQNWESAMFSSWIMQIILSELINVPTTLETSLNPLMGNSFNFYDPELRFTYSHESYVS
jgi:hypothetical protein